MLKQSVELAFDVKAAAAETPCWDKEKRLIYWTDMLGKSVHAYDPITGADKKVELGEVLGTVVKRDKGGVVVALEHDIVAVDFDTGSVSFLQNVEKGMPQNRLNDGKCDAKGRLWISTANKEFAVYGTTLPTEGKLYCIDTDLSVTVQEQDFHMYNGMCWSKDNKKFFVVDTARSKIFSYDFDLEAGKISNKKTLVDTPEELAFPDGLCLDDEGVLYLAHWGGYHVSKWNSETGEFIEKIPVPAPLVTCCAFAGEAMDELYIATAIADTSEELLKEYPNAGGIFKLKTAAKGVRAYNFGG